MKIKSRKKRKGFSFSIWRQFQFFQPIKVGDVYSSCNHHPVRCTLADYHNDELEGIDLFGNYKSSCSIRHCGPTYMSPAEVDLRLQYKEDWLQTEREFHEDWYRTYFTGFSYQDLMKREKELIR